MPVFSPRVPCLARALSAAAQGAKGGGGGANNSDDGGKGRGKGKRKRGSSAGTAGRPQQAFDARKVLKVSDTIRVGVNTEDNESTVEVGLIK